MPDVECIWPAEAILGEAPLWCPEEAALYWVDIEGRKVFRLVPQSGKRTVFSLDHEIGCIVHRAKGGFLAALDAGLAYLSQDLTKVDIFADPEVGNPGVRLNDGKCDRRGRFWTASTDREETQPLGSLYCLSGTEPVHTVLSDVIVGNGLGWSPDNRIMYFTDTGYGAIYAFDYDIESGTPENRRLFASVDEADGAPDGLTVDAEGFVWSAHWNGWRITRYDPAGQIDRTIDLPVPNVTSLAFGGPDLDRLYITSAKLDMSARDIAEAPLSGGLFAVDTGIRGLPEIPFTG